MFPKDERRNHQAFSHSPGWWRRLTQALQSAHSLFVFGLTAGSLLRSLMHATLLKDATGQDLLSPLFFPDFVKLNPSPFLDENK